MHSRADKKDTGGVEKGAGEDGEDGEEAKGDEEDGIEGDQSLKKGKRFSQYPP